MHLFIRYILSITYVPGVIEAWGEVYSNEQDKKSSYPNRTYTPVGKIDNKSNNKILSMLDGGKNDGEK